MKILAIESAATVASVALIHDGVVICDYTINDKKTHSQTIMPMIEAMKKQLNLDMATLDAIAVSAGPGSYTGLRIGSATAKGLAHVLDIPIVGISTIKSLAYNISKTDALICPMLDARRQHVFAGVYRYNCEGNIEEVVGIDQMAVKELMKVLDNYVDEEGRSKKVIFLGDGYKAHQSLIEKTLPLEKIVHARGGADNLQRAVNIGLIGERMLIEGGGEDYITHQPDYYRLSQAEREYEEKQSGH